MAATLLSLCAAMLAATPDGDSRCADGPVLHECNRLIDPSDCIPIVHADEDCQLHPATNRLQPVPRTRVTHDCLHFHDANSSARDHGSPRNALQVSITPQRAAHSDATPANQPASRLSLPAIFEHSGPGETTCLPVNVNDPRMAPDAPSALRGRKRLAVREHRRGRQCIHSRVFTPPNNVWAHPTQGAHTHSH